MKYKFLFTLFLASFHFSLFAQQIRPEKSSTIYKQLQQLQKLSTVMYIAAHPDDENTRLITYLVNHDHVNTVYLSLTRGDGGQNILGDEQGAALGLIRTNEMMMARKIDGAKQLFTRFIDFGFTKSPDETFSFWNKVQVIEDVKTAIQQFKPDVLICRFPTTGEGGHGQHTASAIAALEAFKQLQQSNDPNVWKPKRILFNAFKFGTANTIKEGQFELPINQYDPILGEAYGEVAGRSRSEHKSQGAGTPQSYGVYNENFELLDGAPMKTSFFDDIDTSWTRIGRKDIGLKIQKVIQQFDFNAPQNSVATLIALKKEIANTKNADNFWIVSKLKELDNIILSCSGLQMEILANNPTSVKGTKLKSEIKATSRINGLQIRSIKSVDQQTLFNNIKLENDVLWKDSTSIFVDQKLNYTQPYWLSNEGKNNQFNYPKPYQNEPLSNNDFVCQAEIEINNTLFKIDVPVSYKRLEPTRGDVIEPVKVLPELTLEPMANTIVVNGNDETTIGAIINSNVDAENITLQVLSSEGNVLGSKSGINIKKGQRTEASMSLKSNTLKGDKITYKVLANNQAFNKQMFTINYEHIPSLVYYSNATSNLIHKNWTNNVRTIGYINGAGDKVATVLSQLGMDVTFLTENDLSDANALKKYDAIVCGVRLANTRKDLEKYMPNLWQYISNGGTVVMQYNTSMGLEIKDFSPTPITLSRDRVTDENATITFLNSNDPILNQPNKISKSDFENWVQERGIYYPSKYEGYNAVVSMHDKDEKALESGIIYKQHGKGYFVYSSLVFFRQLPAGNTGAIRLFMNLLNIGKNPSLKAKP